MITFVSTSYESPPFSQASRYILLLGCTQRNVMVRHRAYSDVQHNIKGLVYKRFAEGCMHLTNTLSFLAMYPL